MANVADVINADGGTAPDYYLSNLHKWCMSPMAAAFLWVSPTAPSRASLHHPIISHCCGEGFKSECAMLGSRDYSSMLAIPAALDFIDLHLGGIDAMCKRNASLCYDAALMLSAAWGTQHCMAPASLCTGCAMIGCPQLLGDTFEDGERLRLLLRSWKPPHSSELQGNSQTQLLSNMFYYSHSHIIIHSY